jgi:serine/threonine protein phosphatase PrpC
MSSSSSTPRPHFDCEAIKNQHSWLDFSTLATRLGIDMSKERFSSKRNLCDRINQVIAEKQAEYDKRQADLEFLRAQDDKDKEIRDRERWIPDTRSTPSPLSASESVSSTESSSDNDEEISCSGSEQSKRDHQEDRLDIYDSGGIKAYAVYDGHGGAQVSEHLKTAKFLQHVVTSNFQGVFNLRNLEQTFVDWDTRHYLAAELDRVGSTAVIVVHKDDMLHAAWVGDSRAVLFAPDGTVLFETTDHKASREWQRIRAAGGLVDFPTDRIAIIKDRKVFPMLAMSRSFGDRHLKIRGEACSLCAPPEQRRKQRSVDGWVTSRPSYANFNLATAATASHATTLYLAIASDGIWDCCPDAESAAHTIAHFIDGSRDFASACESVLKGVELLPSAASATRDNKTLILVRLTLGDA